MFDVLIAEDSKPILRNIKALLHSSSLPIRVVATAANGEEALEALSSHAIDILITDIRMPRMDGLTLISQTKITHPKLKVVLISGYNDFEYTRKAINLQVSDYLLKPIERNQLIEVMERVTSQLKEEQHTEVAVFEGIIDPALSRQMKLNPDFFVESKLVLVVHKQLFTSDSNRWNSAFLQAQITQAFPNQTLWVFPTNEPNQMLILTSASLIDEQPSILPLLEKIRLIFLSHGLPVSIAGSFRPSELQKIPELYKKISQLFSDQLSLSRPVLLDINNSLHVMKNPLDEIERLGISYGFMIQQLQKDRFMLKLTEQLKNWQLGDIRIIQLRRFVSMLSDTFATSFSTENEFRKWELLEQVQQLFEQASYEAFCAELLLLMNACFSLLQSQNKKNGQALFQQIDDFLKTNLYSQITMTDLSANFHISPSYISRIVKRFSQNTFVHHYLELKINEARKLIETNDDIKIKEISDALCFHDQHYFSKVFKEYTGCSPSEYKAFTKIKIQTNQTKL